MRTAAIALALLALAACSPAEQAPAEPEPAINSGVTIVVSAPVLALEKRFIDLDGKKDQNLVEPRDLVEYRIVARNDGSVTATGVEVTDVLPAQLVNATDARAIAEWLLRQ